MNGISVKYLQERIAFGRDEVAYRELFLTFYKGLFRLALEVVKCRESSEEVVSDVMMKIWTMNGKLAEIDNLKVYLYKATLHTAINQKQKNNRYLAGQVQNWDMEIIDQIPSALTSNPEEKLIRNEWSDEVKAAVESLPPKCRLAYKLIRENGLTYKEVAGIMDISENTVDRHLNTAIHKLVDALKIYKD